MTDYAIVKLSNGENIICRVVQKTDSEITVQSPMIMESVNKITQAGIYEHLSLYVYVIYMCITKTIYILAS